MVVGNILLSLGDLWRCPKLFRVALAMSTSSTIGQTHIKTLLRAPCQRRRWNKPWAGTIFLFRLNCFVPASFDSNWLLDNRNVAHTQCSDVYCRAWYVRLISSVSLDGSKISPSGHNRGEALSTEPAPAAFPSLSSQHVLFSPGLVAAVSD